MKRSKLSILPEDKRALVDRELVRRGFADYAGFVQWLKDTLGIDIGRSSAHRYGSNVERRIAALKDSSDAAKLIADSAPDDANLQSAAVMRLVQHEIFEVVVALQKLEEDEDPMKRAKLLTQLAKVIAPMANASVRQKQHEAATRAKAEAAAKAVAGLAKKGGLSGDAVAQIRAQILGIAQ